MGSNTIIAIFIKWHYMFAFTENISPNFVNEFRNWFCFVSLVLVLSISTLSGVIIWFLVQYPILHFFVFLFYSTLASIVSVFIDPNNFPWVLLQIFCRDYTKQSYQFSYPIVFRKVVSMVPVGCSYFPSVINQFLYI